MTEDLEVVEKDLNSVQNKFGNLLGTRPVIYILLISLAFFTILGCFFVIFKFADLSSDLRILGFACLIIFVFLATVTMMSKVHSKRESQLSVLKKKIKNLGAFWNSLPSFKNNGVTIFFHKNCRSFSFYACPQCQTTIEEEEENLGVRLETKNFNFVQNGIFEMVYQAKAGGTTIPEENIEYAAVPRDLKPKFIKHSLLKGDSFFVKDIDFKKISEVKFGIEGELKEESCNLE